MTAVVELSSCPACGSSTLTPAFARETTRHNSIARLDGPLPDGVGAGFTSTFRSVRWTICKGCGLAFAGRRPPGPGSAPWYLPLFKLSEERGYDVTPLPADFVASKAQSGEELFAQLTERGLLRHGARLLHVRCATGELLKLARDRLDADVWGVDFFPSCVAHAAAALGEERVAQMTEPEPENPFPQKTFDVIVSNHMITHAHDPAALVGRFRDWLSDDGVLVVLNEPDHARTLKGRKAYARGINFFHKQLFTEATFVSSMRGWGFEPERIEIEGAAGKKLRKNMMFACRKRDATPTPPGDWQANVRMLAAWNSRRRLSDWLRIG